MTGRWEGATAGGPKPTSDNLCDHGRPYALLADAAYATAFALWRIRRAIQRKPDPDPPQFLTDFLRHSTAGRGLRLS